ncbi:site-specific integrase [Limosilactobacillus reuteri]|uniref:Site-specific integrase n=1 Tax=Limosilactobacillus agrestis TaxID=2759748 RepID=A0A7W3UGJ9_9LACO|nr:MULTISPECIES: site-specific integrase [Limosilactobacillus]MBD5090418.1 site-specific integrase [Lactobacillus sp.]MBB1095231.1 site-specific integrase [Limosilactobacillus agrestis]MCC4345255.1 site-specific integrase [Limosilactobacillus reuteri]MCT3208709.1 site-specific integrase [Limosilactobacillus reuteri]MCT3216590.1 site-specific integrase [Limosilactobacillus reuteri]
MSRKHYSTKLFYKYYMDWIKLYKEKAVRKVTLDKYYLTHRKIKELAPELHMNELTRQSYQKLLNNYAATHEKQTTLDFHHHLKAALVDALDEGLLEHDPTRRAIIKGVDPSNKKNKFLNLYELQKLLRHLNLGDELNWDWFILLVSKTGLRFAEALALTPEDFDFERQQIIVNKSWNYKTPIGNFQKTKNESSNRVVMVDWHLMNQFKSLIRNKESDWPIFVPHNKRVFNSTVNGLLEKYCYKLDIPTISVHGLRHTHASLLLYEGVSVASVAKRLGHANTTTTQETYIHIIEELENKDNDKVLHHLSQLN